jgi:hypothetical protein
MQNQFLLHIMKYRLWLVLLSIGTQAAESLRTNSVNIANPPSWVRESVVERCTNKAERFLEWSLRKVTVTFYSDLSAFQAVHRNGPLVMAFARASDQSIHLGPKITKENFEQFFTHELVHAIVFQKFNTRKGQDSIPKWLEEGLANFIGGMTPPDYSALERARSKESFKVKTLTHPFGSALSPQIV